MAASPEKPTFQPAEQRRSPEYEPPRVGSSPLNAMVQLRQLIGPPPLKPSAQVMTTTCAAGSSDIGKVMQNEAAQMPNMPTGTGSAINAVKPLAADTLMSVLAEASANFDVDLCVLVMPTAKGFKRLWHSDYGVTLPPKEELDRSRLFKLLADRRSPMLFPDIRASIMSTDIVVTGPAMVRFYAEVTVRGGVSDVILGTFCIASQEPQEAEVHTPEMSQRLLSYATRLARVIVYDAGVEDDCQLPHMTHNRHVQHIPADA
ncbi:unnamed protein product [Polarella glacialis]|uniref:Uncharacterized protein n=2 Tax=Polarella glacialis TaxID=89957 RepID=A0A813I976_POLGL|nr:unnamed protein product [Polarella glacialis]|mmetsp:Transcript_71524/g.115426  ORF Transcript_71524/g.115426 Transcript_71524/m.115426 type:complete len:260 (-) Transcript_71524:305-1084(-)